MLKFYADSGMPIDGGTRLNFRPASRDKILSLKRSFKFNIPRHGVENLKFKARFAAKFIALLAQARSKPYIAAKFNALANSGLKSSKPDKIP
ncbi:MAG: hypothetical protein ACFNVQ_07650 [Campylobacter sp.]|uniref:hypothetical protein n=1 Tax=uncultured Campylobacter sp. TaxID=218934 RepID=UPI00261ADC13|nr:hypothetical protein [uncultured Campylobacter sp.]